MPRSAVLFFVLFVAAASADESTSKKGCSVSKEIYDLLIEAHEYGFRTLRYSLPESVPVNTKSFHDCTLAVRSSTNDRYWLSNGVAACYDRHPCFAASIGSGGMSEYAALYNVIENNAPQVALALIEKGADPNEAGYNGWTPLSRAAQFRMLDVVKALLENGADPTIPDTFGLVALDYATHFFDGYRSGELDTAYLGKDFDRKIDEFGQIAGLLEEASQK